MFRRELLLGAYVGMPLTTSLSGDSDFLKDLTDKVIVNVQFFISYVIVTGSIQIFFRLSQAHNLLITMLTQMAATEEAMSQRRLHTARTNLKSFHLDEFIPLFSFVFMVGALYATLAPLSGCFVAGFFHLAYKVFKYMTLYVYGNRYEGGGFLFYTISNIVFSVLYIIVPIITAYFSLHASGWIAGIFVLLIPIIYFVQRDMHKVFVVPSKTLSISKARAIDAKARGHGPSATRQRKLEQLRRLQEELDQYERSDEDEDEEDNDEEVSLTQRLYHDRVTSDRLDSTEESRVVQSSLDISSEERREQMEAFQKRYDADDTLSDLTGSDISHPVGSDNFFIYRQPSLNRATWELSPRPYRQTIDRDEDTEIWR